MSDWHLNSDGLWCPSCGNRVAGQQAVDNDEPEPEECRECGFPDPERVADYHVGPDDDQDEWDPDDEDPGADCGRWINGKLGPYCSKAGSEECDWECPYGL